MLGIRLDSGDLAYLSIEARKLLDAAGFPEAQILASSDLDEHLIESLKHQGAKIGVWGVGTRLVTGYDDPALGGVYKLTARVTHQRRRRRRRRRRTPLPGNTRSSSPSRRSRSPRRAFSRCGASAPAVSTWPT